MKQKHSTKCICHGGSFIQKTPRELKGTCICYVIMWISGAKIIAVKKQELTLEIRSQTPQQRRRKDLTHWNALKPKMYTLAMLQISWVSASTQSSFSFIWLPITLKKNWVMRHNWPYICEKIQGPVDYWSYEEEEKLGVIPSFTGRCAEDLSWGAFDFIKVLAYKYKYNRDTILFLSRICICLIFELRQGNFLILWRELDNLDLISNLEHFNSVQHPKGY